MASNRIKAPKGTHDVLPGESYKWQYVEGVLRETARRFGYREIRFPAFEHTELFLRGVGDTTDVVQKEMYTFEDKGGRSITLRPEGTASVVRSFIENALYAQALPQKMFYIAPNFRYEKPQAGRYREHHQFGAECFGSAEPAADADMILLLHECIKNLGLRDITLELNSIGCPECRPVFQGALRAFFEGKKEVLCGACAERLERNPMRVLDCKSEICRRESEGAPVMLDSLCGNCRTHFEKTRASLDAAGIEYRINPRIVRGLDYYTRTVFEFVSEDIGSQGAVGGGGRYDGLVSQLGGPETPGVGFGSGIERFLLVMEAQSVVIPQPENADIFIASAGEEAAMEAGRLCFSLRGLGLSAERDLCARSLKAQMKYADKLSARHVLVLGGDELSSGMAALRDMRTGAQRECALGAEDIYKIIMEAGN